MAAGDRVCSRSKTNLAPTTKVVDFNYPDRMLWTVVSFNSAFPPNADINRNASNDRCVSINGQPRELANIGTVRHIRSGTSNHDPPDDPTLQ
jgi:hypothetical protein